jgi:uncharacterized protein involved in exopolysaccharide biosynthesis/Mrp family chromosome partitioning ATPase
MTLRADDVGYGAPERAERRARPRQAEEASLDLRGVLRVLARRRATVLVVLGLTLAAAAAFTLLVPPLYTAGTQVLIDPRDRRVLQTEVTPTGLGDAGLVESQVRIVTSAPVLRRLAAAMNLADDPEFGRPGPSGFTARLRGLLRLGTPELTENDLLERISRRVSVRRAERTYIMDIRVSSRDPAKAARLADELTAAYLAEIGEAAVSTTRRTTGALTSRLDELRENLRQAENRAQAFRARNAIVGAGGATVTEQQLTDLNGRLVLARARVAELASRVAEAQRLLGRGGADTGAIPEALQSPVIASLRSQLAEISRREAELGNQLGPRHPAVVDVRAQLGNVRRLIGEEVRRIAEGARNELAAARANERSLAGDLDRLQQRTLDTNQASIELREHERAVEAARQLYEAFLNRSLQTSEQERIDATPARVVAAAVVPTEPSFPPRLLVLALALFGGLGIGVAAALVREHLDDTFRSAGQLRRIAGLDLLAAVPRARRPGADVVEEPSSGFAVGVRALRDELRGPAGARPRSLLLASAQPGEGKTTIALNLALAAAVEGERVLLIDVDAARRALTRLIAPEAEVGAAAVLAGDLPLAAALVRDPRSDLHALPLEAGAPRLSRTDLARLVDAAKDGFDLVVLDGPPLLADHAARAAAETADVIVLVVRAGSTRHGEVLEALQVLRAPRARLAGAVLNMAELSAATRYEVS